MELEAAGLGAEQLSATLRDAARRLDASHPRAASCGAASAGELGDLGRAWAGRISGALVARADEARTLATAASDLGGAVRASTSGYRDAESRRGSSSDGHRVGA